MEYHEIIANEWKERARDLAEWAMERLVNRQDVWGQYTGLTAAEKAAGKKRAKALTLPARDMRGKDMVTIEKLVRHFGSGKRHHLIGLHSASAEGMCRWGAIDIDLHDPDAVDAEDGARRNFAAALGWWEKLQKRGYDPLLIDSDGAGGFHLWVLFSEPAPIANTFAFLQDVVADWENRNLDSVPETFPKKGALSGDKLGAWLRLQGLHHTRKHFTKVWSGDPWLDDPWQEGMAAIDSILQALPGPPPPEPPEDDGLEDVAPKRKLAKKTSSAKKKGSFKSKSRPMVCVDFDGVLSEFHGWVGVDHFGEPIPGAVEFSRCVSEYADIVVHTARTREVDGGEKAAKGIRDWLDSHGFHYHDVHVGIGKPLAKAYIDDRAVGCRPQETGPAAFSYAEERVRELAGIDGGGEVDASLVELMDQWPELTPAQRSEVLAQVKTMRGDSA